MLIENLPTKQIFFYQYRPTDKAEWGTFLAIKEEVSAEAFPTISDLYSFDNTFIETMFEVTNEAEFNVLDVLNEAQNEVVCGLINNINYTLYEDEDGDENGSDYSPKEIREYLVKDYPEYFI